MKDYERKPYTDLHYSDWMHQKTAKSVWDSILERHPGNAEFSRLRESKTTLEKSIARYLKQSETKKPYVKGKDFVEMESMWEGPGDGISPVGIDFPTFDQPWNVNKTGSTPWTVIFDAISSSCYCPGQETDFEISGTHPIYGISLSFSEAGTALHDLTGFGTNTVIGTFDASANEQGSVNVNIYMTTWNGISGDANYLMPECRDCCDEADCEFFVNNEGVTPNTIGQDTSASIGVSGGTAPYTWVLTQPDGSGFSIDADTTATNTLYTTAAACGSADLQVTDSCGCVANFSVRCTTGHWLLEGTGESWCDGCNGPPYCDGSRGSGWVDSIPYKSCYPTNCKYYYYERLRRTIADSDWDYDAGVCESERAAADCTGGSCTVYGTGGMYCDECVGHPTTLDNCVVGSEPPLANINRYTRNPALYTPDACILSRGKYYYCRRCYQSFLMKRYVWECA